MREKKPFLFLRFFPFAKDIKALRKQIGELERKMKAMESDDGGTDGMRGQSNSKNPPITIETLHVEKIIIEKMDYTNNLGQLGIKELTGKLNIGTSYEGTKKETEEAWNNKLEEKKLKLNMRGKSDKDIR